MRAIYMEVLMALMGNPDRTFVVGEVVSGRYQGQGWG